MQRTDGQTVSRGAAVFVAVALPPVFIAQLARDRSVSWDETNWWIVPVLSAIFAAPFVTAIFASKRQPERSFVHSAAASALGAFIVLLVASWRLVTNDKGIPIISFLLYMQITISIALFTALALLRARSTSTE